MADSDFNAPEPSSPRVPRRGGGGSGLLADIKKIPLWVWPLAAIALFFAWRMFFAGNTSSQQSTADQSAGSSDSDSDQSGGGSSGASNGSPPTNPDGNPTEGGISQPVKNGNKAPPAPSGKGVVSHGGGKGKGIYVVQSGDTLNEIAAKHGVSESELYSTNESVIESTARARRGTSSHNGWFIYPGEKLVIP